MTDILPVEPLRTRLAEAVVDDPLKAIGERTGRMAKLERLIPHSAAYVHEKVAFHAIAMRISGDRLGKGASRAMRDPFETSWARRRAARKPRR